MMKICLIATLLTLAVVSANIEQENSFNSVMHKIGEGARDIANGFIGGETEASLISTIADIARKADTAANIIHDNTHHVAFAEQENNNVKDFFNKVGDGFKELGKGLIGQEQENNKVKDFFKKVGEGFKELGKGFIGGEQEQENGIIGNIGKAIKIGEAIHDIHNHNNFVAEQENSFKSVMTNIGKGLRIGVKVAGIIGMEQENVAHNHTGNHTHNHTHHNHTHNHTNNTEQENSFDSVMTKIGEGLRIGVKVAGAIGMEQENVAHNHTGNHTHNHTHHHHNHTNNTEQENSFDSVMTDIGKGLRVGAKIAGAIGMEQENSFNSVMHKIGEGARDIANGFIGGEQEQENFRLLPGMKPIPHLPPGAVAKVVNHDGFLAF